MIGAYAMIIFNLTHKICNDKIVSIKSHEGVASV